MAVPLPIEEPQVQEEPSRPSGSLRDLSDSELWERAAHASQTLPGEGASSSSGSTQAPAREVIDVSHISATSPFIVNLRRIIESLR